VITGLGRRIQLVPELEDDGAISDFYYTQSHIFEGQFKSDSLNGFGRRISADGTNAVGWFED
jgi:hypothetical protein